MRKNKVKDKVNDKIADKVSDEISKTAKIIGAIIIHRKKITLAGIIIILICLFFLGLFFYFTLGFDLSIQVNPSQKILYLYHNQTEVINFELVKTNNIICYTQCEYSIFDNRENKTIFYNIETIRQHKVSFNYSFYSPGKGRGQEIYNVEFKCRNIKTIICQTKGKTVYGTSLIILNYDMTQEELNSSQLAQQELQKALDVFAESDVQNQKNNILSDNFNGKIKLDAAGQIDKNNLQYQDFSRILNELRGSWDTEEYSAINEQISEINYNLINYSSEENALNYIILNKFEQHNNITQNLIDEKQKFIALHHVALLSINNPDSQLLADNFFNSFSEFLSLYQKLNAFDFEAYDNLSFDLSALNEQDRFTQTLASDEQYIARMYGSDVMKKENALLCNIKGACLSSIATDNNITTNICSDIMQMSSRYKTSDQRFAYNYFLLHYPENTQYNNQNITKENVINFLFDNLNISFYLSDPDFNRQMNLIKFNEETNSENSAINYMNSLSVGYNENIDSFNQVHIIDALQNNRCVVLVNYFNSMNNSDSPENFYAREYLLEHIISYCSLYSFINATDLTASTNSTNEIHAINLTNPINQTNPLHNISTVLRLNHFETQKLIPLLDPSSIAIQNKKLENISQEFIKLAIISNYTESTLKYFDDYCIINTNNSKYAVMEEFFKNISETNISVVQFNFSSISNLMPRINTILQEHKPMCCVFEQCRVCCNETSCPDDPSTYPIIFVHGHAANKAQSPHYSLAVFDILQNLLQSEGYLNAGIILPESNYSDVQKKAWSRSGYPVTVKFTYYLDVYNNNGTITGIIGNSEYIENYSVRLNRAIELLKYRTGKSKVIIIAHSMGGLVAREYVKEFGDDSVYKLVMIGTPNYGIEGQVDSLCPFLGESKECTELTSGSDFLKKLNSYDFSYNFSQDTTKYYTIIGKGCDTSGLDGDGVVPAQNVNLSYSKNYYINGSCDEWFNPLHVQMLEQIGGRYNQTYNDIQEILKE